MSEIIFHHYPASPFSEKIRVAFGIKNLPWRSVQIPNMMPKPDLLPLTGGYRKTPVMQIGADIFCDTQIILRELERRFPTPALFANNKGLSFGLAFWTDRLFFMPSVGVVFAEVGDMVPEAFKEDRAKMSGTAFSTDAMKAMAPFARDQWRAHTSFLDEQLAGGRHFLEGPTPQASDVHGYMNIWWIKAALPHLAETLLAEFPAVIGWASRMAAIGHGQETPMDSRDALEVAKISQPQARQRIDPFDPRGLKPFDKVTVSADDYGRDPIEGEIVFSNSHEIAILRRDAVAGDVVVHLPRAGFVVQKLG